MVECQLDELKVLCMALLQHKALSTQCLDSNVEIALKYEQTERERCKSSSALLVDDINPHYQVICSPLTMVEMYENEGRTV